MLCNVLYLGFCTVNTQIGSQKWAACLPNTSVQPQMTPWAYIFYKRLLSLKMWVDRLSITKGNTSYLPLKYRVIIFFYLNLPYRVYWITQNPVVSGWLFFYMLVQKCKRTVDSNQDSAIIYFGRQMLLMPAFSGE